VFIKNPLLKYQPGQQVTVYIIKLEKQEIQQHVDTSDDEAEPTTDEPKHTKYIIDLSMKQSRITNDTTVKHINTMKDITVGELIHGYIKHTSKSGCFIWITPYIVVRCELKNLNDRFITDVQSKYYCGKLVTGM
jgi:ribosomal protein S1